VIEHDGGAEGFRSLADNASAPCKPSSSASVSKITTSFRTATAVLSALAVSSSTPTPMPSSAAPGDPATVS
jgi:hypothetical protein